MERVAISAPVVTRYAVFVACVLLLANVVSFVDRQIIGLLAVPLKEDLGLSDIEYGFLAGFSFATIYTGCGLFTGYLADRCNRRNLIAAGIAIWSTGTLGAAFCDGFTGLLAARLVVAAGESALNPAAYSLIYDYFPSRGRGRAVSLYSGGIFVGSAGALLLGGGVISHVGASDGVGPFNAWQAVFAAAALPGFAMLALMMLVREPPRSGLARQQIDEGDHQHLRRHWRSYAATMLGFAPIAVVTYGFAIWLPSVFSRAWNWSPAQFATTYGAILLSFGLAGMACSGWATDRLSAAAHERGPRLLAAICAGLIVVCCVILATSGSGRTAITAVAVCTFLLGMNMAALPLVLLRDAPARLRGRLVAACMFLVNIVGLGLGPLAVGWLSDSVLGEGNLQHSFALVASVAAALGTVMLIGPLVRWSPAESR